MIRKKGSLKKRIFSLWLCVMLIVGIVISAYTIRYARTVKDGKIEDYFVLPTGWNGRETANAILEQLKTRGYADAMRCVATGYGRICVDYADKIVTEITCHGKGGWAIFKKNMTIIDVGGQDTKMIKVVDGQVADFLMNDKCAAGTGKFIEFIHDKKKDEYK